MTSEELGAVAFVIGYAALLAVAVKVFGVRKVAWALAIFVFFAVVIAFKTLGAVTSSRRY